MSQNEPLLVSRLQFEAPDGQGSTLSSLESGTLQFLNSKDKSYGKTEIVEGQYLSLLDYEQLNLTRLNVSNKTIELTLEGKVGKLLLGNTKDDLKLQNPSILQWLLNCKVILLITSLLIPILITLALYLKRKL